jgi:type II secretion system (T2SS) protein E
MEEEKKTLSQGLTDILMRDGVISPAVGNQLEILFKDSEKSTFTDFLMHEGFAERRDILEALSEYYQVPWFDTQGYFFDHALVNMFPKGFLLRNSIIPVEVDEDILVFVAGNPANQDLPGLIEEYASYDVRFEVGIDLDIQDAVKEFYDEPVNAESHMPDDLDWPEDHRLVKEEEELEANEIEKDREEE